MGYDISVIIISFYKNILNRKRRNTKKKKKDKNNKKTAVKNLRKNKDIKLNTTNQNGYFIFKFKYLVKSFKCI